MPRKPDPPSSVGPETTRRDFVLGSVAAAVALGAWPIPGRAGGPPGGVGEKPPEPRELRILTPAEAAVYDAWCDQLAPGAAEAGVSRYLDAQLSAPPDDCFLFLRVLANPPFEDFYRGGIAGIEREARARFGKEASYASLDAGRKRQLIEAAAAGETLAWKDPAPGFFFLVSRGDAVDVAYGTEAGFRRLQTPYAAHIRPPTPW